MDLGDAVRPISPLNTAVAQPAGDVDQSPSGEVSSNELSQTISDDHGVPVGPVVIVMARIGRHRETGPYAIRSFRGETNVGVTANTPDQLHICPRATDPPTSSIDVSAPRGCRVLPALVFFTH